MRLLHIILHRRSYGDWSTYWQDIKGQLLCYLGKHSWRYLCSSYTDDEWDACNYCLRAKPGSLEEYAKARRQELPE